MAAAAYAALTEFERLAALLPLAPRLTDRVDVAAALAHRHQHSRDLLEHLREAGRTRPEAAATALAALTAPIDDARNRVASSDWWEALAATALSAPLTEELFTAILGGQSPDADASDAARPSEELTEVDGAGTGADGNAPAAWAAQRLRNALREDPVLAARIAMWGRRLAGEAIVLAREFGGEDYPELADRLAASHARRLADLGLAD